MKQTLLLLLALLCLKVNAADTSTQITYTGKDVPLKKIFSIIKEQTGYVFFYRNEDIAGVKPVTVSFNKTSLEAALNTILKDQQLQYVIQGNTIVISRKKTLRPATIDDASPPADTSIQGKVVNSKGEPQPGATVLIKGTKRGTTANENGVFTLRNVPDNAVLLISALGLKAREIPVTGVSGPLTVTLESGTEALSEVVVVGYGQVKKSDLTGAVATVPVGEIKKVAVTSLDQAIQGRVAGVQVTQNSGAPGGSTTIRIRGGNSIQGDNEPLYVIDGVPFKNGGAESGSSFNVLSTLNPGDIESMTILKDASSTAIYGSRGSNGVVIITTKRGKAGRTIVSFDTYYGTQDVRRKYPVLNAKEYAAFVNEANTNDGLPAVYTPQQVEAFGEGTDWQDEIFRTAPIANYQLSMSGGDEKTQFAVSAGYFTQKGVVENSDFNRYSFRVNLDRKINNKIKVGNSLTINRTATNQSRTDGSLGSAGLVTMAALQFPPLLKARNADGTYLITDPALNFTADNPVALAFDSKNKNTAYRFFGNIFGEYQIIEGLTLKVLVGIDGILQKQDSYLPRSVSSGLAQGGVASIYNEQSVTWLNENLLTYSRTFNKVHSFSALVGYTQQENRTENSNASSRSFVNDILGTGNLGTGAVATIPGSGIGGWGLVSYLGRINYGYRDKYLLTASFRADGSSRFGVNNRFGFFPSGAIAWKVSEEPFLKNNKSVSDLKLRVTYGTTGNQDGIGNYPAYSLLGTQNYVLGNNISTGLGPSQIANPDLSWEKTAQGDVGVDLGLFNSRVMITADAYLKKTSDLLLNVTIPSSSGYSSAIRNLGKVQNKGIELSLSTVNVDGAFRWTTDINYVANRNKVLNIGKAPQIFAGQVANIAQNVNSGIIRVGEPLGTFYGYVTDGLYQSEAELAGLADASAKKVGDRKYKDLNGDKKIDDKDRQIIGSAQPKFSGGISNTFSYKGIDLTVFLQGVYGNKILNANRFELEYLNGTTNQDRDMLDRWTPTHTNTDIPRAATTRPANRISTRQIEDGSYLRLKNIQLGYNLPDAWLKAAKIHSVRLYITAQNLITWTKYSGYDPEVNRFGQDNRSQGFDYASYPAAKTFLFGLNITL
ncbi:TonB-dependent receptor [Chitinophaga filiformis]|uniref:TonB-linked outer membrane protein, SusC/RagA family n=1 Tax=Chitinophaga filiformis TaxID=104663 RepID=A0A1G7SQD8_CHIFI|nr:TonB-dependent receptor [Chitinophaga filiformis]SDG24639.1 TonB-linked outer membrane protein, SusC/RagA family [Chitinophaga filiformis]